MQEVVNGRRQQHRDHRQEKHSAEQRVPHRKDLRGWSGDGVHRTHPRENHHRIQSCVQPRQSFEHVIADCADSQRQKDKRPDDCCIARKPTEERAPQGTVRGVRHVEEYTAPREPRNNLLMPLTRQLPP